MRTHHSHSLGLARPHAWWRRILRSTRGQALVETALGVLLILGATWAVVDAGALFWTYLTLENAVTEAARYATTQQTISGLSRVDSIKTQLRSLAAGITIPDSEISFFNITDGSNDAGGPSDLIQVSVQHFHSPVLPLPMFLQSGHNQFRITVSSMVRNEPRP